MKVQVINKSNNALPKYETEGSAGMDVRASFINIDLKHLYNCQYYEDLDHPEGILMINPGGRALIPTNLFTAIPEGYEIDIRSRSGLALKNGIQAHMGLIDSDYRNSIGIILFNFGDKPFIVNPGDRIAQVVLHPVTRIEWEEVETLDETERGLGGFGHSGVK